MLSMDIVSPGIAVPYYQSSAKLHCNLAAYERDGRKSRKKLNYRESGLDGYQEKIRAQFLRFSLIMIDIVKTISQIRHILFSVTMYRG